MVEDDFCQVSRLLFRLRYFRHDIKSSLGASRSFLMPGYFSISADAARRQCRCRSLSLLPFRHYLYSSALNYQLFRAIIDIATTIAGEQQRCDAVRAPLYCLRIRDAAQARHFILRSRYRHAKSLSIFFIYFRQRRNTTSRQLYAA